MQTIEAILESYIYKNDITGYCAVSLSNGIKAVGILPNINEGERLKLTGEFITHLKYGEQFNIESFEIVYPSTMAGLTKYLGSGLIKGIGNATAEKIVDFFKEETIDILDTNINRLLEVDGIGAKKLELIKKSWSEQKALKEIMIFLQSFEISASYALKIYRVYGADSVRIIKENPYQLTYDVWGIGFKIADSIAFSVGFSQDDPKRIKAGIIYLLNQAASEGHVYLSIEELINNCTEILGVDADNLHLLINEMEENNRLKVTGENVYLNYYYEAERNIERRIKELCSTQNNISSEEINSLKFNSLYSKEQLEAIINCLQNKILILTGGPGTGKTTTLKGIIDSYSRLKKTIMLAAPTGRAAKRMSELIGMESKTIHRLLEYNPQDNVFMKDENDPLETDLLVIDEVSMIDTLLMSNLISAVSLNTTLVLVGDVDQLPSVGSGNVLQDLIQSGIIPTAMLTEIFRQAKESNIVVNAHKINKGEFPSLINNETSDFFFIQQNDNADIADEIANLCKQRLPQKYGFDPMKDIQILTPMHKGNSGANNLNKKLQQVLNFSSQLINRGDKCFKNGDKVMQLRNNYDKDVYNGDIGTICKIDDDEQKIEIYFNGRTIAYEFIELEDITLAYAITVHKSQGSEYPCVIMPITTAHYIMLQRNLLYTAVTRASKVIILIGSKQALSMAIGNKKSKTRNTSLFSL